ncbi:MAG: hypothetical protein COA85_04010 [Robiginitomaculum sp.]|nr:MAG: hypothetical protein COA85_04010 [Robiginitomaculum sp.]
MIKNRISAFVLFFATFTLYVVPVVAAPALPAPLEAALVEAEVRNAKNADAVFYFRRKIVRFGEIFLEKSFNPDASQVQRWAILYPDFEKDPKGYAKQARRQQRKNLKHSKDDYDANKDLYLPPLRQRLGKGVTLVSENDDELVYGFEIGDSYYVSGEGKGANIAKYMNGKIAVGKKDGMIHWLHYVAQRPFHPIPIAKVKQFDIYQKYAPAWYGGPLVKVEEHNKVAGKAIIRKIRFDDVVTNHDFRPIAKK